MKLKVHTYFETLPENPDGARLLELWKENWTQHGWEPVVLFREMTGVHPLSRELERLIARLPSTNSLEYESACWRRWLAVAVAAAAAAERMQPRPAVLVVDYDVLIRGAFDPGDPFFPTSYSSIRTPAVMMGERDANRWLEVILNQTEKGMCRHRGRLHCSDMSLALAVGDFWDFDPKVEDWCPVPEAPLLHACAETMHRFRQTKLAVFREELERVSVGR